MKYQERVYRNKVTNHYLKSFHVCVRETDLLICSDIDLTKYALHSIYKFRGFIESYIKVHPEFLSSLAPLVYDEFAPDIVRDMLKTTSVAFVGPMASVAGAIAEYVCNDLLIHSKNVIVENGGDIFLNTDSDVRVAIFAGDSPLSYNVNILLKREKMPIGICTSSGTVGHSLSFGKADAVCVISKSSTMADAAATAVGNMVQNKNDMKVALERGITIDGVLGIAIIVGEHFGAIGDVELV
jgi:ApbE superfamily uncharacterized protein (UPF0280 family)